MAFVNSKKIEIKYIFVGNSTRNNFTYCTFSKFSTEFELKIKEALGFEIH
jgi:hypothetical protein